MSGQMSKETVDCLLHARATVTRRFLCTCRACKAWTLGQQIDANGKVKTHCYVNEDAEHADLAKSEATH